MSKEVHEIMNCIYKHKMDGVIFHQSMADFYDFMRLIGFKDWQHHQFEEELGELEDMQTKYISMTHMLLSAEGEVFKNEVIPETWYEQSNMGIDAEEIKKQVKGSLHLYMDWEEKTKALYLEKHNKLIELKEYHAASAVREMAEDVAAEIEFLEEVIMELESVVYSPEYIHSMQERFTIDFR